MAYTIAFVNQKGGVGKTTLSWELYYNLVNRGYTVAFYNLDNQSKAHKSIEVEPADFVIVDTPGHLDDGFQDICRHADLVIIPCRSSSEDIDPLITSWKMATATGVDVRVVVNEYDSRNTIDQDFIEYIAGTDMKLLCKIPHSTKFAQASAMGTSVSLMVSKSKPAVEAINKLTDKIEEIRNGREN